MGLITAAIAATCAAFLEVGPSLPAPPTPVVRTAPLTTGTGVLAPLSPASTRSWVGLERLLSDDPRFEYSEVWVYGDSITVRSARNLAARVGPELGSNMAVDAQVAIPTTPATERLLDRLRRTRNRPRVLVFALGTNDVPVTYPGLAPFNSRPQDVWKDLAAVRRAVGAGTSIVFVETYANRRWAPNDTVRRVELANARLVNAQARRSRIPDAIVPWYDAMARNEKAYLADGVHTTAAGADYRASVMMPILARQYRTHQA
ncbi:GDSL-type esterase/lipase family protein [Arsenicicoccus dermatophilus]|uniref:GDSL-type esterase/lipase family protein n=1 Tax=Arsenicicoccus dermatophilus TaxID=1076331 RepID=UPI001F4C9268|nr:GDSL-type esterase/lipase family protein [Arsenicicoccus dermatophilus]MCH8612456.1 GDSL-type esterase/lipase family protein [Arsenicicoccus dermatophilus]